MVAPRRIRALYQQQKTKKNILELFWLKLAQHASAMPRPEGARFSECGAADYVKVLLKFTGKGHEKLCTYSSGGLDKKKMKKNRRLLLEIRTHIAENHSCTKKPLRQALKNVAKDKFRSKLKKVDDQDKWAEDTATNIMKLCRDCQQAIIKGKDSPPEWLQEVLDVKEDRKEIVQDKGLAGGDDDDDEDEDSDKDDDAAENDKNTAFYYFGWDTETGKAWRKDAASKDTAPPEFTDKKLVEPSDALPTDAMLATFADGAMGPIQEWTVEKWRARTEALKSSAAKNSTPSSIPEELKWEGLMSSTKNTISVKWKKDRRKLMCMYEQGKQLLQIAVKLWGDEGDESTTRAFAFMKAIGEDYASGKINLAQLKEVRGNRLKADDKKAYDKKADEKKADNADEAAQIAVDKPTQKAKEVKASPVAGDGKTASTKKKWSGTQSREG